MVRFKGRPVVAELVQRAQVAWKAWPGPRMVAHVEQLLPLLDGQSSEVKSVVTELRKEFKRRHETGAVVTALQVRLVREQRFSKAVQRALLSDPIGEVMASERLRPKWLVVAQQEPRGSFLDMVRSLK